MRKALPIGVGLFLTSLMTPNPVSATHTVLGFEEAVEAALAVDLTLDPPPNDAKSDFVVGGFQRSEGGHTGFSAHSGPTGEGPFGYLTSTFDSKSTAGVIQERFRVTCLAVVGNQAAMGLEPADTGSNDAPFQRVLAILDAGAPGGTGDMYAFFSAPANTCAAFVLAVKPFAPLRGSLVVHDSIPQPEP